MTLLRDIVHSIKAPNTERPQQTPLAGNLVSAGSGLPTVGITQQLQTYTASAVLFSVIGRIAEDVADTQWTLARAGRTQDIDIDMHPFLDLWNRPNPFTTQFQFLEASQQHMELVGEIWWVVVRQGGMPSELWLVRPDRMRPVPDSRDFVKGYIYTIGQHRIPLDVNDVIFIRRPSPLDAYRGMGPVGSLLLDLEGERAATAWNRQFFRNSAEPGGVIEFEEEMDDDDWERFRQRWQEMHQGVNNAHRVAVIERGKWVDRKFTQRDMQFKDMRVFHQDLVLLAYGVNKSIMGITDDVNRANAEAGEVNFARRVIKPRLTRLLGVVNEQLLSQFGDDLVVRFADPTPEDRERNLLEATQGYQANILTLNEARRRLGEDEVGDDMGGNEFRPAPAANPFFGPPPEEQASAINILHRVAPDPLLPNPLDVAASTMQRGWEQRLSRELDTLIEFIGERMDKGFGPVTKIELSDIDAYNWDWWTKYGDQVIDELVVAFTVAMNEALPDANPPRVQQLARAWAEHRGAELLRLDGGVNMVRQTTERVRQLVAETIDRGDSVRTLQRRLREDVSFSRSRAETVARTETRIALGQGQKGAALEQGRNEKRWITQGSADPRVDPVCLDNEKQGWIPISNPFQSGADTVPEHPRCMCTVVYRTAELHLSANGNGTFSKRCPDCQTGLALNLEGEGLWCNRCKKVLPMPSQSKRVVERDEYGRIQSVREVAI